MLKKSMENDTYQQFNHSNINPKLSLLLSRMIMPTEMTREAVIIFFYSLIIVISIFGNSLVCNVVCRKWRFKTSTQIFIINLSISDLLMTVLNIPFNLARVFLDNWPFGRIMCVFVPLVQVASVYISTFTMTCIAYDRFYIITRPLKPRMSSKRAIAVTFVIWCVSITLSLPEASFYRVESVFTYMTLVRCRINYPKGIHRKYVTLALFLLQYAIPLSVTGIIYVRIMCKIWKRRAIGAVTEEQKVLYLRMKVKTIKMAMIVVLVFALCWFPLNLYHLLIDFDLGKASATVFFLCHWLAMSSVCYNPFIYCWLNENFRSAAKSWTTCFHRCKNLNSELRTVLHRRRLENSAIPTTPSASIPCTYARNRKSKFNRNISVEVFSTNLTRSFSGTKV
ncbi:G-protein coupled receptor 83-like [Centruroides vittatus]|uniref:G-protein coupled receptor 83-like n=1 Tax=Centruroides vittatus TaxID=120091 RepID=UPI0035104630